MLTETGICDILFLETNHGWKIMHYTRNVLKQDEIKNFFYFENGHLKWKISTSNRIKVGDIAGTECSGYYRVRVNKKRYMVHCLIWIYHYGDIPDGYVIDHINGDSLDYSLNNLQMITEHQNTIKQKAKSSNKHGFRGVYFKKDLGKWTANITFKRKRYIIGDFDTKELAALAYNKAASELYGDLAVLNIV